MKNDIYLIWLLMLAFPFSSLTIARTFTVTNTLDEDENSFRWAVEQADDFVGADTILFAIPTRDPGYDPEVGVWTIQRTNETEGQDYWFDDGGTFVDGFSQARFIGGDPNPLGPEIELKAYSGTSISGLCMNIHGDSVQIHGLCVNGFYWASISISGWPQEEWAENTVVAGCYIGLDATGSSVEQLCSSGLQLYRSIGARIGGDAPEERNIIAGGRNLDVNRCSDIAIINNYLGTDRTGTVSLVGGLGLDISHSMGPIMVRDNLIDAYEMENIMVNLSDSDDAIITFLHNRIGVGLDGSPMGGTFGIDINYSPGHLIKENIIANIYNRDAISLGGDITDYVTISRNSIYGCRGLGIQLWQEPYENQSAHGVDFIDGEYGPGPNEEIDPCRCDSVRSSPEGVGGTTTAYFTCMRDCLVEVFVGDYYGVSSAPCPEPGHGRVYSGKEYIGDAEEIEQGAVFSTYRFSVSPALPLGTRLTSTATNQNGSTSEFWCSCTVPLAGESAEGCVPEGYRLLPPSPNPATDVVRVRYKASISGSVHIKAYDLEGNLVAEIANEVVQPGEHAVLWDLTNSDGKSLPSGVYLVRLVTESFVAAREVVVVR